MSNLVYSIEGQHKLFTILGIRFWDVSAGRNVTGGLSVITYPDQGARIVSRAFKTVSGIYAFKNLPGLREIEFGASADELEEADLHRKFIVEVTDQAERFVPVVFAVDLPLPERGLFPLPTGGNPADDVPGFFMFSAPSRASELGWAVVRAHIAKRTTLKPAAHAVLEVTVEGTPYTSIADEEGRVAVMFPYPAFRVNMTDSLPEDKKPLHEYTWDLDIRVLYAPESQQFPRGSSIPLLTSILAQPEATQASTNVSVATVIAAQSLLRYGEETVLLNTEQSLFLIESD